MQHAAPSLESALAHAIDLLPMQAIIENFVHHNPLHHFEDQPFHTAIAIANRAIGMSGYQSEAYYKERLRTGAITADALRHVLEAAMPTLPPLPPRVASIDAVVNMFTGADKPSDTLRLRRVLMTRLPKVALDTTIVDTAAARVSLALGFDPRPRVHEALSELAASFLNRGAAPRAAPHRDHGFVTFFAWLETTGAAGWRAWARARARVLQRDPTQSLAIAETIYARWGVTKPHYESTLRTTLAELPGWSGMFARMESKPLEAPAGTAVRLIDYVVVHAILTESSLRSAAAAVANVDAENDDAFGDWIRALPDLSLQRQTEATGALLTDLVRFFERNSIDGVTAASWPDDELTAAMTFVAALSGPRRRSLWLEALERSYARELITGITITTRETGEPRTQTPSLQVISCIDDREESLRRYIEAETHAETFGVPGFFGLAVTYHPSDGREPMTLCPLSVVPTHELQEIAHPEDKATVDTWVKQRRLAARVAKLVIDASRNPFAAVFVATLLMPFTLTRLLLQTVAPSLLNTMRRFYVVATPPGRTLLVTTHSDDEAAELLAIVFHDIGLTEHFAPLFVVLGHGSHSFNNPYFAAYDCGACSGRHSGPNARLFAQLANKPSIRALLAQRHDIHIPETTWFIGGNHDTASDDITLFDKELAPVSHTEQIARTERSFAKACTSNAFERCRRFLLDDVRTEAQAWAHVKRRSENASEVRPELNHATNASTVIGRRYLTEGLFLDRRTFMSSYDPLHDDARGTHLERVLAPGLIVCSGISLEYYFSATDPNLMGAGTKAPLNVVGHIGVLQGAYGDLRPGLPTQMTETHTPIRSTFVVDAPLERLNAVLDRRSDLKRLVFNEWVKMAVRDPTTGAFWLFERGAFRPFEDPQVTLPRPTALQPWFIGRSSDLPVAVSPSCARVDRDCSKHEVA